MKFRVTLQKCKENEHDKQITGQIKTWFKNSLNKESFKRVVALTLIERMGVRKISLKSV
ncbi:hypothetical protein [Helicobacter pylori]|uniref:hypothetical protein n=1 Tax=Helicobacter pylori TaxID=210 RepID=UPI0002864C35|nr:hypothetical protein [Helicobacter pylori]EKE86002.1 hypothetical protein OUG_0256 [Helicobacter pylori R32b]